ncbi:MAG: Transcriptional regulator, AsnC family, partial [uncultured Rubrobacteraceae bacterium]
GNGGSPGHDGEREGVRGRSGHAEDRGRHRGLLRDRPVRPRGNGADTRLRADGPDRPREARPGPRCSPHRDHGRLPHLLGLRPRPHVVPGAGV